MKKCYRKRSEGGPIENRALLKARAWFLRSQGLLEVFQKARKMTRASPRVSRGTVKVTPWIPINAARVPRSAPKDLKSTPRSPQGSPKVPPGPQEILYFGSYLLRKCNTRIHFGITFGRRYILPLHFVPLRGRWDHVACTSGHFWASLHGVGAHGGSP